MNGRFEEFERLKCNIHNRNHIRPAQIAVESRLQLFERVCFTI
nr:MAG TPA: hypothetical protein [Caudoviricetes sp.]